MSLHFMPWDKVEELMHDLEEKGLSDKQVRDEIVKVLDTIIPAHLLPPPWGCIAEFLDGPGIRLALNVALASRQGRERRRKRKAERKARLQQQ